jgi:hypothetical protein
MTDAAWTRYFYVYEAGDPTLFDRRGNVIAGEPGCSSHFILGALDVADPAGLTSALGELHRQIVTDPFYAGVESLKPERLRTHRMLHAKDDLPEIRERVFRLLATQDVRFHAVVRDKRGLAVHVRNLNAKSQTYRYTPNQLYDELVKRLFRDRLHKDSAYRIVFAKRGSKDRTHALRQAIDDARINFQKKWGIAATAPIEVSAVASHEDYCLQAADYFLWAVQRVYSSGEDRFVSYLWHRCALVHDVDDRRKSPAGCYYTEKNPLTAAKLKGAWIEKEPGI